MITLKHLVLGAGVIRTRPGPYLESWPKIVLFVVVVAVLGGVAAIWHRSHYHPYHGSGASRGRSTVRIPSREERLVQRAPTRTTAIVRPRCVPHRTILLFASAFP